MTFIRIPSNLVALVMVIALFLGATVAEAATGSHWPLDEKSGTAARDIILDNDATLVNGPVWVSGKNNSALSFDGSNDTLKVLPHESINDLTKLDIDVWIYPETRGEQGQGWIVGKAKGGTGLPSQGWMLRLEKRPVNALVFAVDYSSSHLEVMSTKNAVVLNAWNHVRVTWDGTTNGSGVRMYVNDTEVAYTSAVSAAGTRYSDSANSLFIGADPRAYRSFDGLIDEVKVNGEVVTTSAPASSPDPIYGCTDKLATNYNPLATVNDGSCTYASTVTPTPTSVFKAGSTVKTTSSLNVREPAGLLGQVVGVQALGAIGTVLATTPVAADGYVWVPVNFNSGADGWVADAFLSTYVPPAPAPVPGCTDKLATNYNPLATVNDGSCVYPTPTPEPTPIATTTPVTGIWKPDPYTTWQWQLTGAIDTTVAAEMFDIDLFDVPQSTIDDLKKKGRIVICYFSAGSYEDWRPDASDFPAAVLGNSNGWAGEKWLDIRRIDLLAPIMEARMDLAVKKGCHGVEPDNIDGYTNRTGFTLTGADQIAYNKWLAVEAHERGLSIGLKNDIDQVRELEPSFDWALNEQCHQYNECDTLLPFIQKGKAVFITEYGLKTTDFCASANNNRFMAMKKNLDLDASRQVCWNEAQVLGVSKSAGQAVRVLEAVRVRTAPGTGASVLGVAYANEAGKVVEGPTLHLGEAWYKVNYNNGLSGWTYGAALEIK